MEGKPQKGGTPHYVPAGARVSISLPSSSVGGLNHAPQEAISHLYCYILADLKSSKNRNKIDIISREYIESI